MTLFQKFRRYLYGFIAAEIAKIANSFCSVCQIFPLSDDDGLLRSLIPNATASELLTEQESPCLLVLNGNANYAENFVEKLTEIKPSLKRQDRLLIVAYNSYLRPVLRLLNWLGLRSTGIPLAFLTHRSLKTMFTLAGFEAIRVRPSAIFPFKLYGIGDFINRVAPLIPLIRELTVVHLFVLRPTQMIEDQARLSMIIPLRNESGNIAPLLRELSDLGRSLYQVIFIEGHSTDNSADELATQLREQNPSFSWQTLSQTGKGKGQAVWQGIAASDGEIIAIVDSDRTVDVRYAIQAAQFYRSGLADFINGDRLSYPMEEEAMRPLNRLGNLFFAKLLSYILDINIVDSLCGLKVMSRKDLDRLRLWREQQKTADPFGDFDLLFGAVALSLKVIDFPVRYRARRYGSTNIQRFRDGVSLLRFTLFGLMHLKLGATKEKTLQS